MVTCRNKSIMSRSIFFILVFLGNQSFAQVNNTGSNLSVKDAQEILAHHNKVRKKVGSPALSWNTKLSAYAQSWADHLANENNCEIEHRAVSGQDGKTYGENIFWGSSAASFKPVDASLSWYSEIKKYSYAKLNGSNWHNTGHYTQMVWKNTQEVGVGVAICPNGAIIIVANYYPAGNYMGQYPY